MEARNREADSKGLSEGGRAASRLTSGKKEVPVCDAGTTEGQAGVAGR